MSRPTSKPFLMSVVASIVALGGACSHDQTLTRVESPAVAGAVQPHATPARSPVEAPVAVIPKRANDDDAIFFDFDSALLRTETRPVLQKVAAEVRGKEQEKLEVDGNCDELGTVEYNLALGDQRAGAAKEYLIHLGVPPNRIHTVSYGAQRPKFPGHDDNARAKNRRDDLVLR